jgi:spore coat polysaccharide biosynthesis protein SpsF
MRLKRCESIDEVVLATTKRAVDTPLVTWAETEGVSVFRGDLNDVLGRFRGAAEMYSADVVYRANGDSPLIAPEWVNLGWAQMRRSGVEFITGKHAFSGLPVGAAGEWITYDALKRLDEMVTDPVERDHVTGYIFNNPKSFNWAPLAPIDVKYRSSLELVVDTQDDFDRFENIIARLGDDLGAWSFDRILAAAQAVHVPH